MRALRLALVLAGLAGALASGVLVACHASHTTDDADAGDPECADATTFPLSWACTSSRCPPEPPTNGTPCPSGIGLATFFGSVACEYGANRLCTTLASCFPNSQDLDAGFSWSVQGPDAGCGTNDPSCPADYGATAPDGGCPLEGTCNYEAGTCQCLACTTGKAGSGPNGSMWKCASWAAAPGCPEPRPLLGTACTARDQGCSYGTNHCDVECGGVDTGFLEQCTDGVWSTEDIGGCILCEYPTCGQ